MWKNGSSIERNSEIQKNNYKWKRDNILKSYYHHLIRPPISLYIYVYTYLLIFFNVIPDFPVKFFVFDLFVENQSDKWRR